MTCHPCTAASINPHCGLYAMDCIDCCARLVTSARPSREHQEVLLETIDRSHALGTKQGRAAVVDKLGLK